jgi:branched-chain amino acid transport system substrate-binding protein
MVAALARPALAEVLVGVAGPAQGPNAAVGAAIVRGAKGAAERINAAGGILGEPVAIVEADDACAPAQAERAARAFVGRGVKLVVGHPCASAAIAAARIYARAGVLFIAPTTRHPALTEPRAGATIFRLAGRDDRQGASAGNHLARAFPGKPLAVVSNGSRLAQDLARDALAALEQADRSDVLSFSIRGGQKDYAALIAKLAEARTEALFFAAFPIEGGLLLKQMRDSGLSTVFLANDASATSQLAETAGDDVAGAEALLPHDPARNLPEATRAEHFALQSPTGASVSAYAALEAWRAAADAARSLEAPAVGAALQQGRFETVLGRLSFAANGDADVPSYDVVGWKDGAWRRRD